MSKYVVLDLEMCKVPEGEQRQLFPSALELIQIGAVELDEHYKISRTFQSFVKPEFGSVDGFIQDLTGITAKDVADAPTADVVLKAFIHWLEKDAILVTWSEHDVSQIDKELYYKDIDIPDIFDYLDNYIDCQYLFSEKLHAKKSYKLSEALAIANIKYELGMHDAMVDAINTARLFSKLQNEDRSSFSPYFMTEEEARYSVYNSFATRRLAV
jgi:DNA polymerase III epsilon subunit-like protein